MAIKGLHFKDFKTQEEAMGVVDEIVSRQKAEVATPEFWEEHPPKFSQTTGLLDEFYYINDQGYPCMHASIIIIRNMQLVSASIYCRLQLMPHRRSVRVCDRRCHVDGACACRRCHVYTGSHVYMTFQIYIHKCIYIYTHVYLRAHLS